MPPTKPGPDPDQNTPNLPVLRSGKVWETGVAPDDTRIPGTRRLWLAGALALAVVSSCVTAIVLQDSGSDDTSQTRTDRTTLADDPIAPLSLPPASPTSAPDGKTGLSEPQADKDGSKGEGKGKGSSDSEDSGSSGKQQGGAKPTAEPSESRPPGKKPPSASVNRKSVQAVNYPDRYWHLSGGVIRLDQVGSYSGSETREDSTFKVVSGLARSDCYSFRMSDGRYVRHQNFRLRVSGNDGSNLFKQDATFCAMRSPYSDAVMLQSVNYPDRVLRHRNFELVLDPYGYNTDRKDFLFRLVKGLD